MVKNKKNLIISLALACLMILSFVSTAYCSTSVNYDKNLLYPSKWTRWKTDWEDDEPSFNYWENYFLNGGGVALYVKDEINWDYSDAGIAQGRVPHGNGAYYASDLAFPNVELTPNMPDGKLIGYIRAKYISGYPKKVGGYSNPTRAWTACAGLFFMVFIELEIRDTLTGATWKLNYDDPDRWGGPNMLALEMSNRWAYDWDWGSLSMQWHQVDGTDYRYNFFSGFTTHDSDYHLIKAGWIFNQPDTYQWFSVDFGKMFREAVERINYDLENIHAEVVKGYVKAISISVECYLAEYKVVVNYVELVYNP